jgi:hypothetical protein
MPFSIGKLELCQHQNREILRFYGSGKMHFAKRPMQLAGFLPAKFRRFSVFGERHGFSWPDEAVPKKAANNFCADTKIKEPP